MGRFVTPASRTGVVIMPETVFQTRTLSTFIVGFVAAVQTWMCPLIAPGGGGSGRGSFLAPCHQTSEEFPAAAIFTEEAVPLAVAVGELPSGGVTPAIPLSQGT